VVQIGGATAVQIGGATVVEIVQHPFFFFSSFSNHGARPFSL